MNSITRERLFGFDHAFDDPVTLYITIGIGAVLAVAPLAIWGLGILRWIGPNLKKELMDRYKSWLILAPAMLVPVLLGAAWTIAGIFLLSVLCYREFARATGFFRFKILSLLVVCGMVAIFFAVIDNWYPCFVAMVPLSVAAITAIPVLQDRPHGYIQRVALGVFALMLFGSALGHLAFLANDSHYRPMIILIFLAVELNDVFAYVVGKPLGKRKLAPNTSPNKTVAGAVGALVMTTLLVASLGYFVFQGTEMARPVHLIFLGMIISVVGQLGDLMLSSIKRDLGIKDMAVTIPGHGGFLDRFDSLILVSPAAFHYIKYINDMAVGQPTRILTGG